MTDHIFIETVESIVRSFDGQEFHTEEFKTAMASYPPRRRIDVKAGAMIMRKHHFAESKGKKCVELRGGRHRMVTVWRPLI